jgi:hypothetical protein
MKKYFWTILPVILILGALIAGVFIYQAGTKNGVVQEQPSPFPAETLESTPVLELKREDLKIQVLNGRGVAGVAGEAKDYLEELGYQVIGVDNAGSFDYEETEISIKKDKENYLDLLEEDLSKEYTLSEKAEILDTESEFDAVIIIAE